MSNNIVQFNEEIIKGQIKELVRGSVEETLNELLEAEAEKLTQTARYERSEARHGYRSGHYDRNLTTTSGDVTLHVYDLDSWCGKMFPEPSPAAHQKEKTSGVSSRRSPELKSVVFQSLDLTHGHGNLLGESYWELIFSLAWRCLDAQYWGVPQRRKRIFLVADFAGRSAEKILFDQKSLFGYPA